MTECERIVSAGGVDAAFLEGETRADYRVPAKMKKVWAVELDLLWKFGQLCDRHHLRYRIGFDVDKTREIR